jgi:SAM-dependent methyltransferase
LLEVGYGSGLLLPTLSKISDQIAGLDLEPQPPGLVEYLHRNGTGHAVLEQGDVRAIPFPPESFDCVVAFSIFEHLEGAALTDGMSEVARVLQPGGHFLIGCPAVHAAMSAAFAAIGFSDIDHHHVSDLPAILLAASRHFVVEETTAWPPLVGDRLPLGWAPYSAVRLRRRSIESDSRGSRAVGGGSRGSAERGLPTTAPSGAACRREPARTGKSPP